MAETYHITPKRLTKNEHLWKTIRMMLTVNTDAAIVLPKITHTWLFQGNWVSISPGNAALCLSYISRSPYLYPFAANPEAAKKILQHILDNKLEDLYKYALQSEHTGEGLITEFIEDNAGKLKGDTYRLLSPLLSNPSLKTYQYEMIWAIIPDSHKHYIYDLLFNQRVIGKVPDYILRFAVDDLLDRARRENSGLMYNSYVTTIVQEAARRNLLIRNTQAVTVVPPQSKPAVNIVPIEVQPQKLKPLIPGKVYKL